MKFILVLLAAVGPLVSTHSSANSSAAVTLGPLTVQLVDLDLTDGVPPSVDFGAPHIGATEGQVNATATFGDSVHRSTEGSGTPFAPLSTATISDTALASASIFTSGQATGTTFAVAGSADDFTGVGSLLSIYEAQAWQTDPWGRSFVLSPRTQLLVSSTASVAIQGSGGPGQTNGFATLYLGDRYQFVSSDTLGLVADPSEGESFDLSETRQLAVSISNMTGSEMNGYYVFSATVHGEVYASVVPESDMVSLMLAGVGYLFLVRRRNGGVWQSVRD